MTGRAVEERVTTVPAKGAARGVLARLPLALLALALGLALGWVVLSLPEPAVDLAAQVRQALPHSGVTHPVTAVLLNFRGYDTLLEVGVLLLAVVGVWSLRLAPPAPGRGLVTADSPVLVFLVRLLTPVMIVVAGYLLWAGSHRPGGAFQAGAVLGAAGELLLLTELVRGRVARGWPFRSLLALGFGLFLVVAVGTLALGGNLLEYRAGQAYALILLIEAALALSIGGTLAALFFGAAPRTGAQSEPER